MKYWLDTEFIEDGRTIDLISLGIVCEDGRVHYMQNRDCQLEMAGVWVRENVIPHLEDMACRQITWPPARCSRQAAGLQCAWFTRAEIRQELLRFCDPDQRGKPEFWGYYADYDWVALCQLFGRMIDLPNGWPQYCHDIKQLADELGNPGLPEQETGEHHALADAQWNRRAWEFLAQYARTWAQGFA